MNRLLKITDVCCSYGTTEVLHHASFSLEPGETLCIIGANGSGKTTLLHSLMGLEKSTGSIQVLGQDLHAMPWKHRAQKMALLSQHSSIEFPYTIWDTVALGRYCHKKNCFSPLNPDEKNLIDQNIKAVGLWEQKDTLLSSLSGGQLQRVFLARTFTQNPSIILLDEPTNHLDLKVQLELMSQLKTWVKEQQRGVIAVFHDLNFVRQCADKILLLHQGHTVAYGSVGETMTQENLMTAYGLDVHQYMKTSYESWLSP